MDEICAVNGVPFVTFEGFYLIITGLIFYMRSSPTNQAAVDVTVNQSNKTSFLVH